VPLADFYRIAEPQWKLGIRFRWGPRESFDYPFGPQYSTQHPGLSRGTGYYLRDDEPFDSLGVYSSLMSARKVFRRDQRGGMVYDPALAYHLENEKFVAFLESFARTLGVQIEDDTITEVRPGEMGVAALRCASGREFTSELFIDSSGFYSLLIGKTLGEKFTSFKDTLFCDRAVVGGWQRGGDEPILPYTAADTMNAGWCWQIEHEHRINRGYVYSSAFITDEDAEREFRARNPKVGPTRVVKFTAGRYERSWVGNVVGVGNAAGFVEPLEATSLSTICNSVKWLTLTLLEADLRPQPIDRTLFNRAVTGTWETIRSFLGLHYRFNTRLDTPFWRECREKTNLAAATEIAEYYQERGPSALWHRLLLDKVDSFGMEGYLSILLGQAVPYRCHHQPTPAEEKALAHLRNNIRESVRTAFSVDEALASIRSPNFVWRKPA
jgi:tryptophan halogenase